MQATECVPEANPTRQRKEWREQPWKPLVKHNIRCFSKCGQQGPTNAGGSDFRLVGKCGKQLGKAMFCVFRCLLGTMKLGVWITYLLSFPQAGMILQRGPKKPKAEFHHARFHASYRWGCYIWKNNSFKTVGTLHFPAGRRIPETSI